MGDPVTLALGAKAGSSIFSGLAGAADAKAKKQDAEINAYIGRTRAIQTDTEARADLNDELATMRATFAAAGQGANVGTLEIANELRRVRSQERRVRFGNAMQESRNYRRQAQGYGSAAKLSAIGGFVGAAPSLFDIYDYNSKKKAGAG